MCAMRHAHHGRRQEPLGLLERLEIAGGGPVARLGEVPEAEAVRPMKAISAAEKNAVTPIAMAMSHT